MRPRFSLILSAAMLASAAPALAGTPAEHKVMVRTGDLDLTTDQGAARLNARLARAAYAVCEKSGMVTMSDKTAVRQCAWRVGQPGRETAEAMVLAARSGKDGVRTAAVDTDIALGTR